MSATWQKRIDMAITLRDQFHAREDPKEMTEGIADLKLDLELYNDSNIKMLVTEMRSHAKNGYWLIFSKRSATKLDIGGKKFGIRMVLGKGSFKMLSYRWKGVVHISDNMISTGFELAYEQHDDLWVDALTHLNDSELLQRTLREMGALYATHVVVCDYYDNMTPENLAMSLDAACRGWMWQEQSLTFCDYSKWNALACLMHLIIKIGWERLEDYLQTAMGPINYRNDDNCKVILPVVKGAYLLLRSGPGKAEQLMTFRWWQQLADRATMQIDDLPPLFAKAVRTLLETSEAMLSFEEAIVSAIEHERCENYTCANDKFAACYGVLLRDVPPDEADKTEARTVLHSFLCYSKGHWLKSVLQEQEQRGFARDPFKKTASVGFRAYALDGFHNPLGLQATKLCLEVRAGAAVLCDGSSRVPLVGAQDARLLNFMDHGRFDMSELGGESLRVRPCNKERPDVEPKLPSDGAYTLKDATLRWVPGGGIEMGCKELSLVFRVDGSENDMGCIMLTGEVKGSLRLGGSLLGGDVIVKP